MGTPAGATGTRLAHLLELLDGDVAAVYGDLGMADFRPRFTPIVRILARDGPSSIRHLAHALPVTHSAASQTVRQMKRRELVTLEPGTDARQRIVYLTGKARALLPALDAEWQATTTAMAELDAELPHPLSHTVTAAIEALRRRSFRQRIADAAGPRPAQGREQQRIAEGHHADSRTD